MKHSSKLTTLLHITLITSAMLSSLHAIADKAIARGTEKALVCVACHGADGIGKAPDYPNLRGQKVAYLKSQLKAFRDGTRVAPFMSAMARPLTDQDIADISAYFSSLPQQ